MGENLREALTGQRWQTNRRLLARGCRPAPVAIQDTDGRRPLDEAAIQFIPSAPNRKKTGCAIQQGKYVLPADNGLLPGEYRVDILDLPPLTHTPAPPRPELHRYANDSPLKLTLEPNGTRTFNFELNSTPRESMPRTPEKEYASMGARNRREEVWCRGSRLCRDWPW